MIYTCLQNIYIHNIIIIIIIIMYIYVISSSLVSQEPHRLGGLNDVAMRCFSEGGRRIRLNVVAYVSSQVAARFLIVVDEDAGIESLYAKAPA